ATSRRLPLLNHSSLWLGVWIPTRRIRIARSVACRCNSMASAPIPRNTFLLPSISNGAVSCSTSPRAPKFYNLPHDQRRQRSTDNVRLTNLTSLGGGGCGGCRAGIYWRNEYRLSSYRPADLPFFVNGVASIGNCADDYDLAVFEISLMIMS